MQKVRDFPSGSWWIGRKKTAAVLSTCQWLDFSGGIIKTVFSALVETCSVIFAYMEVSQSSCCWVCFTLLFVLYLYVRCTLLSFSFRPFLTVFTLQVYTWQNKEMTCCCKQTFSLNDFICGTHKTTSCPPDKDFLCLTISLVLTGFLWLTFLYPHHQFFLSAVHVKLVPVSWAFCFIILI